MVAVYPNAVKKFAYRQDFTELVEAADVNVTYDEIAAIESTLGVLPNTDIIDGVVSTWPTVKANISAARSGVSIPFANVNSHNFLVPYASQFIIPWTGVTQDTHSMWTGGAPLVCPRTGIYDFQTYIRWHKDGLAQDNQQPVFNRNGKLEVIINPIGSPTFLTAQTGYFPVGAQMAIRQSTGISLHWEKGQSMEVIAFQSCLTTPITATCGFSISFRRTAPTLNNL